MLRQTEIGKCGDKVKGQELDNNDLEGHWKF